MYCIVYISNNITLLLPRQMMGGEIELNYMHMEVVHGGGGGVRAYKTILIWWEIKGAPRN